MKLQSLMFSVVLAVPACALASEQYMCVPDNVVGLIYSKTTQEWKPTTFRANMKWIISARQGSNRFVVTMVGDAQPFIWCKEGFNEYGYLLCEGISGDFKFNKKNGRYIHTTTGEYVAVGISSMYPTDAESSNPAIQIGKCSPF